MSMIGKQKHLGAVIFNGEYPPGVFFSEKHKILRPLIFFSVNFFPYKLETPYSLKFQWRHNDSRILIGPAVDGSVWDLVKYEREFPAVGFHN